MGLDIYLYNVKKNENIKEGSIIDPKYFSDNVTFLPIYNEDNSKKYYCDVILNNSVKVFKDDLIIDFQKIYNTFSKVHKEKYDVKIGGWGKNQYIIYVDNERFEFSVDEIKENYSKIERHEYYMCILESVAYQRGLPDEGWEYLPNNCEYCDDEEVLDNLLKNGLDESFNYNWKSESTVLLAWW